MDDKTVMNLTGILADFAAGLDGTRLPAAVERQMSVLLIDIFRAAAVGIRTPWAAKARRMLKSLGGRETSSIFLSADRADPVRAAYLNGVISGSLDWDDSHIAAIIHPGIVVWPATLALGEMVHASGTNVLAAATAGYEVAIRIGMSIQPSHSLRGFQGTPTCGVFGAATTAAKLLGLDAGGIRSALGLAASYASGLAQFFQSGSGVKRLHAGKAAAGGLETALLAQAGLSGPPDAIEGEQGFARAFADQFNPDLIADRLGEHFWLTSLSLKVHAGTVRLQAAIEAAEALAREGLGAERIEKVEIGIPRILQGKLTWNKPVDQQQAQLSAPFAVAMAFVLTPERIGPLILGLDDFGNALANERIRDLAARTICVFDLEIDQAMTKEYVPARVTAYTRGGRRIEKVVMRPKGCPENPITLNEVCDRFRTVAGPLLAGQHIDQWLSDAQALRSLKDIRQLMRLRAAA